MKRMGAIVLLTVVAVWGVAAQDAPPLKAPQRWYYVMTTINDDAILAKQIELAQRASRAGYTGVALYDCKFDKYKIRPANFDANFKKFRQACTDNKLDFIACVLPMGYCDMFLATDPNLAEGMPVRNAAFVVKDGRLVPVDDDLKLVNGSLDQFKDNQPVGWEATDPGNISFMDETEKTQGTACLRQQDAQQRGHARIQQKIAVKPFHYYHVSAMVKTLDCESKDWRLQPYDGRYSLSWEMPPIEKTMGWKRVHMCFSSLDNTSILLQLGSWGAKGGKVWWDDVQIEPGGFVNLIRRDSLPLKIASEDGKTVYEEGKDFSEVKDAKFLNDPHPGYFSVWHDAPVVTIPAASRLKEGQRARASYHIAMTAGKPTQIMCCMCEPKVYAKIEEQMRWVKETLQPDGYFMMHDEIRQQGWDDSCVKSGKTCGQILADNVKRCTEIIEKVDPGKSIVVWQDMFDPFSNARKTDGNDPFFSYLNRGESPWQGSWEGLAKCVGAVNWNQGSEESYRYFSDNGHQQIISGCKPNDIAAYLKKSGHLPGVAGIMYTTWDNDFSDNFEKYVEAAKQWEQETGGFGPSSPKQ